jgi:ABC-2 type transport system permease protein
VITTSLYFIVFGAAIGSRMTEIGGVDYGSFIVPGLMMLSLFTESIFNASFGNPHAAFHRHDLRTALGAAFGLRDRARLCGRGGTKSTIVALVILATAHLFVDIEIQHPLLMLAFLLLVAATFCLFGFIVGIWAKGFRAASGYPLLIVTPLTFLGGSFYSIHMLPEPWRTITLFNPIVYLINGFRWTFYGTADVGVEISLAATLAFFLICLGIVAWIFRTVIA